MLSFWPFKRTPRYEVMNPRRKTPEVIKGLQNAIEDVKTTARFHGQAARSHGVYDDMREAWDIIRKVDSYTGGFVEYPVTMGGCYSIREMPRGITYFKWWGFSINEGGTPVNIHFSWARGSALFYLYWFGKGISWTSWQRKGWTIEDTRGTP